MFANYQDKFHYHNLPEFYIVFQTKDVCYDMPGCTRRILIIPRKSYCRLR